jgi:hypothetical protein
LVLGRRRSNEAKLHVAVDRNTSEVIVGVIDCHHSITIMGCLLALGG